MRRLARIKQNRVLTRRQLVQVREFFGPWIDYGKVVIKKSRFVFGNRPWTCGNVIRVGQGARSQAISVDTADLIHEFGHVWQHQAGKTVFLGALVEQLISFVIPKFDPYDYGGASGIGNMKRLSDFSTESQAQIIAECWKAQNGYEADRLNRPFTQEYISGLVRIVNSAQIGSTTRRKFSIPRFIDSVVSSVVNRILGVFDE